MKAWEEYQEESASFFRSLGMDAVADKTVQGVRTSHQIDVWVKSQHVGFEISWVVECKCWRTAVSKLHVLALREVVADLGADRGILLSEAGFQSGAAEAANLTNVQVTSLAALRTSTTDSIFAMRLGELLDRVTACKDLYWSIPKDIRIAFGLRPFMYEHTYSGAEVIEACIDILMRARRNRYPFESEAVWLITRFGAPKVFSSSREVAEFVSECVTELESKLSKATSETS